jgi:hypothetical protein
MEKELKTIRTIIEKVRGIRGNTQIPSTVDERSAFEVIRNIQNQRRDLYRAGEKVGLRLLTKRVCEAQIFTLDERENQVLQYAYQVIAMNYIGMKRVENGPGLKDWRASLVSQVPEDYKRECHE